METIVNKLCSVRRGKMSVYLQVLENLFSFELLLVCGLGALIGIILGAIPGMNGGIGVVVVLPFTYTMDPATGILFLGSIYMSSAVGGSISGILINVPGTVESAPTAIEGNAMTKLGRAKEALYYAGISSAIGGAFGVVILIFFTPFLAAQSVKFGPTEMLLIAICGLTIVGSITGKSLLKGIFAALLGLTFAMVGISDTTGEVRFTFGSTSLMEGIELIPVVIGFYAITEMIKQALELKNRGKIDNNIDLGNNKIRPIFKNIIGKYRAQLAKSSILGNLIGILPGAGGAIAAFLAYGEAKRSSNEKEQFGKGSPAGIVATESANNAAVGGAMVPMLALGIPGSSTTAIMFGALMIHGLIPGPRLFTEHGTIAYTFVFGMLLAVLFMCIISLAGVPLFTKILKIKMEYIIPAVLVFSFIGAYSVRNSMFDVVIALSCGIIGVLFYKMEIPTTPIILGIILGPLVESNLVRTLTITGAQDVSLAQYIFTRPISMIIIAVTLYLIYVNYKAIRKEKLDYSNR